MRDTYGGYVHLFHCHYRAMAPRFPQACQQPEKGSLSPEMLSPPGNASVVHFSLKPYGAMFLCDPAPLPLSPSAEMSLPHGVLGLV